MTRGLSSTDNQCIRVIRRDDGTCPIDTEDNMDIITVEIRAAEGGQDAKLLTYDMATMYERFCSRRRL